MKSALRLATAGAAILLSGGVAAHQAGRIDVFRVQRTLAVVNADVGFAFVSPTRVEWPERTFAIPPWLLEDGRRLGPANARLKEIRSLGMGRYHLYGSTLYFSSSDGTDPRLNGRKYHVEAPWPLSRRTAVLVHILLGIIAVSALKPLLLALLQRVKEGDSHIASNVVVGGLAELEGTTLLRWERSVAGALAIGLAVAVGAWFLASPNLASMMLEYALKSVPLFTDGSASSILDFNGAGDPRGRIVNSFFTWVNILVRKELLLKTAIHPGLSINWLLYPLTLAALNRAIRRMTRGPRYAIIVTLLYAGSPGMLDTLVDYHLPGKALVNFWFAGSLYGVSLLVPVEHRERSALGALLLGATTLLGLLSDETAVFIPVCVCLLFGREILARSTAGRTGLRVAASLIAAVGAYGLVVLVAVPLCNALLQQAPLDLPTSVLKGPYAALFGVQSHPIVAALRYYDPASLLQTIVSAHLVPGRTVVTAWTSNNPYPSFWRWSLSEQLALYGVLIVVVTLIQRLPAASRSQIWRLTLTFLVYVAGQSLLLVALSGYVTESSYYAALGSVFVALLIGGVAAASARSAAMRALSWALVAYLMAVETTNMVDTARRHPYLGADSLTWQDLQTVRTRIARGDVAEALAAQPFPARRFLYAFEAATAFESVKGRRIDFRPMEEPQQGLVRYLDIDSNADPSIGPMRGLPPRSEAEPVIGATQTNQPIDAKFFHAGVIRGESGAWGYRWRFDGTGEVVQQSWRFGLMRLWSATGRVEKEGAELCLVFLRAPSTCFASLRQDADWTLAFNADGRLVTRFRWES